MLFFKRFFKGIALLIAALFAFYLIFGETAWFKRQTGEKFFEEIEVRTEARILPDGSMNVKETRTLQFNGDYSRYRRQIPQRGYGEMKIIDVSEPGQAYERIQTSAGRPVGKYTFLRGRESGSDVYNIELYFNAKDEKRTFIIEYRVLDVVKVHTDVAELNWQFLGRNRSVDTDAISVSLQLPPGAQPEEIRVWGHGPLKGEVRKISSEQVYWGTRELSKSRFLEGRVIFPTRLVPQARMLTHRAALNGILDEEKRWADQRAAEQRTALYILVASVVAAIAGCFLAWIVYARYGRKYKGPMEIEYYRELPGRYSPAEAGYFIENGTLKPQAVSATFMDLARRGYIRMEPSTTPDSKDIVIRQLKPAGEELKLHERMLMDFFFNQVGKMQPAVWFSALKNLRKSDPYAMKGFIDSFRSVIEASVESMGFFEKQKTGKTVSWVVFVVAVILSFVFYGAKEYPPMVSSLIIAVAFLLSARSSRDFTRTGQEQFDLWMAFRRFLTDFSSLDRAQLPQLILWEHYLVFAVVLGVAAEVIKQLPIVYPQVNEPNNDFGYYWGGMYHTSYGHDGIASSSFAGMAGFSDMMNSMDDSWDSAFTSAAASGSSSSSSGGDGGGFSGGGGDGGGGGGGDAD